MSDFLKFDLKTLVILILTILLLLERCDGIKKENSVEINDKKFGLLKYSIDTFKIYKTSYGHKKGDDIHHDFYYTDTVFYKNDIDTIKILQDFFSKNIYRDTIKLNDSLGFVYILDTISKNKIQTRTWMANVREKIIKETIITKELPRNEYYLGMNTSFDKYYYLNSIGTSVIYKNKKNNLYQINFGLLNKNTINTNTQFTPYFGAGFYWKLK